MKIVAKLVIMSISVVPLAASLGCGNTLLFTTSHLIGIEVNAMEGGQQTAKVAIQRFEGVSMPACRDGGWNLWFGKPCQDVIPKAYSTLAMSEVQTGNLILGSLTPSRITQVFATGEAAQQRSAGKAVAKTFRALKGGGMVTSDQERLDDALSAVDGLKDAQRNAAYDEAAKILPDEFQTEYTKARQNLNLSQPEAFLAAKNHYLIGQQGKGERVRSVAEALRAAAAE